jgi:hypothetical protein
MHDGDVFEKTPSGWEALRCGVPALSAQTRSALILCNGHRRFGELARVFGGPISLWNLLRVLECEGLIAPRSTGVAEATLRVDLASD